MTVGVPVGRLVDISDGVSVNVLVRVMVSVGEGVCVDVGGMGEKVRVGGDVGVGSAMTGAATDPRSQAINRIGRTRSGLHFIWMILSNSFKSLAKAV